MTTSQADARSRITELIDPGELTRLAQDMIRIPSVYGDEEKVALFLAKMFAEWGYEVTISIGTIEGGTVSSAVPSFCKIKVDRRTLPDETAQTGKKELEDLIAKLVSEDSSLVGDVKILIDALPMEISEDQPVVVALRKATTEIIGHDPRIKGTPYTIDAGILVKKGRIPTSVFGPGDIGQAHRPNESIDDMTTAAKIYALTAVQLLS